MGTWAKLQEPRSISWGFRKNSFCRQSRTEVIDGDCDGNNDLGDGGGDDGDAGC